MMKRKLLLFITCFFLFSSFTVFFVHRHLRSPEVPKKENNEEVKKETNENLTTKKDILDKKEENEDLPWQFTWKGIVPSLILSFLIAFVIGIYICLEKIEEKVEESNYKNAKIGAILLIFMSLIFTFFYFVVFPLLLAMKKYKNKSYWERFWFAIFSSSAKKIFNGITFVTIIIFIIFLCSKIGFYNNKIKESNATIETNYDQ